LTGVPPATESPKLFDISCCKAALEEKKFRFRGTRATAEA
jgi:hypothetical protein